MKVFFTGSNIYGQLVEYKELIANSFISLTYENLNKIELDHTYSVVQIGNDVFYNGAKDSMTHQIQNLEVGDTVQFACTEDKILFLDKHGNIYKTTLNELSVIRLLPKMSDFDDKIVKIACGSKITIALSEKGVLYSAGCKLSFNGKDIVDLRAGREHCLILDNDGLVFSFGRGSRGQLGHGSLEDEDEPKLVNALDGVRIVAIAAGGWHSCAISCEGDVYTWGWNGNGQLGLSKNVDTISVMASPYVLDISEGSTDDVNVIKIACGSRHTVALTDSNKLFGCGWNKYKQLGINTKENIRKMAFLKEFSDVKISDVKCGSWNTIVIYSVTIN